MLAAGSKSPVFASLDEFRASGPVLLAFYKISCPVCQMTLPYLDRMSRGSLRIVAISQDDAASTRKFEARFGVSLPTLLDHEEDGYPMSNAFGISHVPSLFLLEQDGTISMAVEGFVKADLEAIGTRAGVEAFAPNDAVPAWKAG